jgi:hypothetical protein
MQGPEDEPALRQAGIDFLKAEGQDGRGRKGAPREAGDPCAQIVQKKFLPLLQHGFSGALGSFVLIMFSFFRKSQCAGASQNLRSDSVRKERSAPFQGAHASGHYIQEKCSHTIRLDFVAQVILYI